MPHPLDCLRHHVTGAIERGEAEAVTEQPARRAFYVPVERKSFAPDHPMRWFHLVIETNSPVTAIAEASRIVREDMHIKGATIWAAVTDIPSFAYMQELRESYGRTSRKGSKVIAGYSS